MPNKFTGSWNLGQNIPKTSETVELAYMLDEVNAKDITWLREDMMALTPFIDTIFGVNGAHQLMKSMDVMFQDDAKHLNPNAFEKKVASWFFTRKSYALRTISFDDKTYDTMYEMYGADAMNNQMVEDMMDLTATAIAKYQNIYLPSVLFEALLKVPTGGVDFYAEKGFCRNTVVGQTAIKKVKSGSLAGELGSLTRNHYRTIKDGAGLTLADVNFFKAYMGEYNMINKNNLIFMGGDAELTALKSLYPQYSPEAWAVVRNGIPMGLQGEKIAGLKMINVDWTPENKLFLYNGGATTIVTRLQSANKEFSGLSIELDEIQSKFGKDITMFKGSKIKIEPEGNFVTGRMEGMWIDIDATNFSADRIMKTDGVAELNEASADFKALWYKGNNDAIDAV